MKRLLTPATTARIPAVPVQALGARTSRRPPRTPPTVGAQRLSLCGAPAEPDPRGSPSRHSTGTSPLPPAGPRRRPAVQSAEWVYRPIEFMERNRRKFGPTFRARLGPLRNVIFISDPAQVKAVLTGDPDLLRTGDINGIFKPIIGEHSILSSTARATWRPPPAAAAISR